MLDFEPEPLTGRRRQHAKTGFAIAEDAWAALVEAASRTRSGTLSRGSTGLVEPPW